MITEIKKGDRFRCVEDVVMIDSGSFTYYKGKEYLSEQDGCITNEQGETDHRWGDASRFFERVNAAAQNNNMKETVEQRTFISGSKRDNDDNKPLVNHLDPYLRLRFGYRLKDGAKKYGKGNWKLGQDTESQLESLNRHLALFEMNLNNGLDQDEDHLSACIFNIMLIMKNEEKAGISADNYFGTTK